MSMPPPPFPPLGSFPPGDPRTAPSPPTIAYKIAVLAYIFNEEGKLLLLHRKKPPNQDLYSPVGGKLEQALGESPYACALREIEEEVGITLQLADIHLLGIVSERAFPGSAATGAGGLAAHWLMFCFEVTRRLNFQPRHFDEGRLEWIAVDAVPGLGIPQTDRQVIWPLVREHSSVLGGGRAGEFFSVHIDCRDADHFAVVREHPHP